MDSSESSDNKHTESVTEKDQQHRDFVNKEYLGAPEYYREKFRDSIYMRKVVVGMWPTEALLAGGGGIYRVKADPKKWKKGANPMTIMKAQSKEPDESEISITFQNHYQFSGGDVGRFTVQFENGVVTEIEEK